MRDTEAQLVNSRSTPSAATHTATLSTGGFTLTGIFSTRSIMKLLIVAAVVVGGLFWMGGSEDVHAGGKGNDKGAKVTTTHPDVDICIPTEKEAPEAPMRLCITNLGRDHQVETPSGNVVTTSRLTVGVKILFVDEVFFEDTKIIKFNRLDKDGEQHTLRSHLFTRFSTSTVTVECETDIVVANGEIRLERMECETL